MTERYFVSANSSRNRNGDYADGTTYDKYEDAEVSAKKYAAKHQNDCLIFKLHATAKAIVPEIEVIKHTS